MIDLLNSCPNRHTLLPVCCRFGNHYGLSGQKLSKPEMCRTLGACMLIDDNLSYAMQCSALPGFQVLLFDWNQSYPWSRTADKLPHNVHRLHSWDDVQRFLLTAPAKQFFVGSPAKPA